MPVTGHPDQAVLATGLTQPGVQGSLHVDVLVRRPLLLGDRQPVGGEPEVLGQHRAELRPFGLARLLDEAGHQPPAVATDVGQLGPGLFAHAHDPRDATGRTGRIPSGRKATASAQAVVKENFSAWAPDLPGLASNALPATSLTLVVTVTLYFLLLFNALSGVTTIIFLDEL